GLTAPSGPGTLAPWSIDDTARRCAIDVSGVQQTAPSGTASPDDTPDGFTVTLRLRVTDDAGRRGESRRTVYLHHDPDLQQGFPMAIGGSGEPAPFFAHLTGMAPRRGEKDVGQQQLIVPTADGTILALRANGRPLPGWPVHTDPLPLHTGSRAFATGALPTTFYESLGGGAAAGDLDGDRRTDVVAGSLAGKLYVWGRDGRRRAGFPVHTEPRYSARSARDRFNRLQPGLLAAPVLADLDGDRRLEIVAAAMDRHVYVWRLDGSPQPGWPVRGVDRTQMASIDAASHPVVPKTVNGQPVALQGTKIVSTPAVGPLRGDGKPVVVVGSNEEYREASNFSAAGNSSILMYQGLGLLDRANGRLHAIPAGGNDDPAGAGNPAGPELPGWPVRIGVLVSELLPWIEGVPGSPVLADVDGDGRLEVGIAAVVGPAYVLRADGSSFYGSGPDGLPLTLPTDRTAFGASTTSTDGPSVPALGSGSFAPVAPDGALAYVAPGAGFGRLADTNVPAQQLPHDTHLSAWNARTGEFL